MLNVAIAVDSLTDYGLGADRVVSAACEEVIGAKRCPVARDLPPGTVAAWYAIVRPTDAGMSGVRIEFRDRTADGVLIEERALTFGPRDSQTSRLASAGSVIAALVAAREGSLAHPPWQANVLPPASRRLEHRHSWSVDLAGLASPGIAQARTRWGGFVGAHLGFPGRRFALASARFAGHSGNPNFQWWTLSAGGGFRVLEAGRSFGLELAAEMVVERARVSVTRGAVRDRASENGWGGRVGARAIWATWDHASVFLGVDGTVVRPRISVIVGQGPAQHTPPASLGLALGLRWTPGTP